MKHWPIFGFQPFSQPNSSKGKRFKFEMTKNYILFINYDTCLFYFAFTFYPSSAQNSLIYSAVLLINLELTPIKNHLISTLICASLVRLNTPAMVLQLQTMVRVRSLHENGGNITIVGWFNILLASQSGAKVLDKFIFSHHIIQLLKNLPSYSEISPDIDISMIERANAGYEIVYCGWMTDSLFYQDCKDNFMHRSCFDSFSNQ